MVCRGLADQNPEERVVPRNAGQYFLQEALMTGADKAPLVIVKGMAGTAKTFYSLAVGLENMNGSLLCWQITLSAQECERSELAMDAIKRL